MESTSSQTADSIASYTQISNCRLCGGHKIENILNLGDVPLPHFNKPLEPVPVAPLELVRCGECTLLQLKHSTDRDLLFRTYWYRSGINETMQQALKSVVDEGAESSPDSSSVWLDIGANDGTLLSFVPDSYRRIACEPAKTFTKELKDKGLEVIDDYFSATDATEGRCGVITSIAMFYDLDDPNEFVADICKCLMKDGVWINQLSYTPTMLRDNAFDNICHEHVSYWDLRSLEQLYNRHGLNIERVSFNDVNGGSIRVVAKKGEPSMVHQATPEQDVFDFCERVRRWRRLMIELLDGKNVWAYGASTKGVTLLSYLGQNVKIQAVADRNERKHGLWMPGTTAPIVSEQEMRSVRPEYLLVLPWAFAKEFTEREAELRRCGTKMIYPLPNPRIVL